MTEVITLSVCLHEAFDSFYLSCCTGRKHHAPRVLNSCRRTLDHLDAQFSACHEHNYCDVFESLCQKNISMMECAFELPAFER